MSYPAARVDVPALTTAGAAVQHAAPAFEQAHRANAGGLAPGGVLPLTLKNLVDTDPGRVAATAQSRSCGSASTRQRRLRGPPIRERSGLRQSGENPHGLLLGPAVPARNNIAQIVTGQGKPEK
jgi:hypothetical protein